MYTAFLVTWLMSVNSYVAHICTNVSIYGHQICGIYVQFIRPIHFWCTYANNMWRSCCSWWCFGKCLHQCQLYNHIHPHMFTWKMYHLWNVAWMFVSGTYMAIWHEAVVWVGHTLANSYTSVSSICPHCMSAMWVNFQCDSHISSVIYANNMKCSFQSMCTAFLISWLKPVTSVLHKYGSTSPIYASPGWCGLLLWVWFSATVWGIILGPGWLSYWLVGKLYHLFIPWYTWSLIAFPLHLRILPLPLGSIIRTKVCYVGKYKYLHGNKLLAALGLLLVLLKSSFPVGKWVSAVAIMHWVPTLSRSVGQVGASVMWYSG